MFISNCDLLLISILFCCVSPCSDVDSDEFFDADNELVAGQWPTSQVLEPRSMSIPVAEKDPEDIEEDADLIEENDTFGKQLDYRSSPLPLMCMDREGKAGGRKEGGLFECGYCVCV